MVVANAVAALSEIQDGNGREVFQINTQYLFKILRALNECTEWGQVSFRGGPFNEMCHSQQSAATFCLLDCRRGPARCVSGYGKQVVLRNVGIFIVEGRLPELTESQALLQVFILDSLARYEAENTKDAESVIERVLPRLQHANCAVVLSAVKVKHHSMPKQGDHKSVLLLLLRAHLIS